MANTTRIKATDINTLKSRLTAELKKRGGKGSMWGYAQSTYNFSTTPTSKAKAVKDQHDKTIALVDTNYTKANFQSKATKNSTKFIQTNFENIDSWLDTQDTLWASDTEDNIKQKTVLASSGCNGQCTGLCISSCYSSCSNGCTNGAYGITKTNSNSSPTSKTTPGTSSDGSTKGTAINSGNTSAGSKDTSSGSSGSSSCSCGSGCTGYCYGCSGCTSCTSCHSCTGQAKGY